MATESKEATVPAPAKATCTIEFGDDHCRQQTINTLRLRVRGNFSIPKLAARPPRGRTDIGSAMGRMPQVPGLRMALDFQKRHYRLYDPLEDDEATLKTINAVLRDANQLGGAEHTFVPAAENTLDPDTWKTLILELVRKVETGYATLVEGKLPTQEQAEKLSGRRLADPWSSGRKPRYHDELEAWREKVDSTV